MFREMTSLSSFYTNKRRIVFATRIFECSRVYVNCSLIAYVLPDYLESP